MVTKILRGISMTSITPNYELSFALAQENLQNCARTLRVLRFPLVASALALYAPQPFRAIGWTGVSITAIGVGVSLIAATANGVNGCYQYVQHHYLRS